MKFNFVNASILASDRFRRFSLTELPDGTPCIEGTTTFDTAHPVSIVVYSVLGDRTTIHNRHADGTCLYEVHPGDFIGIRENDGGTIRLYSRYIAGIHDHGLDAVPAII